jgi:uncharacterized membrane protein YfcA
LRQDRFDAVPLWLQVVLTLLLGVLTGALSSTVGVGGAVVSTPGIRALGATAIQGVGSTLPSILPSAITGTLRYRREGLVYFPVVRKVLPWGVLAAVGGAIASVRFPGKGHVQMLLTAVLVLYTAWKTSRPQTPAQVAASAAVNAETHFEWWRCGLIGVAAGALSGFLGIGGGIFMVPTFRGWLKLGLKETVATSLACVGLLAIPSTITHIVEGTVHWTFAVPLSIGVIPGAHLGSRWTIATSERRLRIVIGVGLGVMGAGYFVAETLALAS